MLRRLATIAVLTAAAGTGLSAPAHAATDHVICVGSPVGTCDEHKATIQLALSAASANGLTNTVLVGPGTYGDGPYTINNVGFHTTLKGSGEGTTLITLPAGGVEDYITATNATLQDLTVAMASGTSDSDIGIVAKDSVIHDVTMSGTDVGFATGIELTGGTVSSTTVLMNLSVASGSRGVTTHGTGAVTDSSIQAVDGFRQSAAATTATVSRVHFRTSGTGISAQAGSAAVDDSVIDLGTSPGAIGLWATNDNASSIPKSITANHVTIVGGGSNSFGAAAWSASPTAVQDSTIQLTNSIISGPTKSLDVEASNNGSLGANSTATITTSYSDWSTTNTYSGVGGSAVITNGPGHLNVNPEFVNAAGGDYRLAATSPVIDKGAPGTAAPTLDLAKGARVLDGNGDGVAVRDIGAYEAPKKVVVTPPDTTAPNTTITSHPKKRTTKRRVTFAFTSSEAHSTFQCRLDKKAWGACASPRRVRVAKGWHVFKVRAIDGAHNVDATPSRFRFHRV